MPVLCQAGPSPPARDIAGSFADLIYTGWDGYERTRAYRDDLRARARAAGRPADAIRVVPFVRSSEAEAIRFRREMDELAGDAAPPGPLHRILVGTPEQVADGLCEGFHNGAYDGVCIGVPLVPGGLTDFVDEVVPILQRRGVHREEHARGTLRDRLGLPVTQCVDTRHWSPYFNDKVNPPRRR